MIVPGAADQEKGGPQATDSRAVLNQVIGLEARFPVDQWKVDGLHVWPLLRQRLYIALAHQFLGTGLRGAGQRTNGERVLDAARSVGRLVRARLRDGREAASAGDAQQAVLLSDGVSFARIGEQWFDTIMDPVVAALAAEGRQSLLLTPMTRAPAPRYFPSMLVQAHLDATKARATAILKLRRPAVTEVEGLENMLAELRQDNPGAELPHSGWLFGQVGRVLAMAQYFERLIRRTSSRIALVNTYYSAEGMAFVLAARRAGCVAIDVQHGSQLVHPAYGRWTRIPPAGFELLPHRFWCWSDQEIAIINRGPGATSAHRALNVGNLWAAFLANRENETVRDLAAQLNAAKARAGVADHLLLTLSWGLADSEMEKLISAVRLGAGVHWWLRLHPTQVARREEFRARFADLGIANVEIDLATDLPLPLLLAEMDVNVTPDSSTVLNAIAAGIPSVITTANGALVFAEQIARGQARFADDPAEIVTTALNLARSGRLVGSAAAGASVGSRLEAAIADAFGNPS